MIDLLITIFTGGGAVGLGSIFKMFSGWLDSRAHLSELKEARKAKNENLLIKSTDNSYTRATRRVLAVIGVSTLALGTLHCTFFPSDPLVTVSSALQPDGSHTWSIGFGLIEIPRALKIVQVTTGHIALANYIGMQMILGYYFTPGGRK